MKNPTTFILFLLILFSSLLQFTFSQELGEIAYCSDIDGDDDIYLGIQNLTNNTAADWNPAWSPDGSQIAFASDRDGNFEIYLMDTSGNNQVNISNNPADDYVPSWSPSGLRIVFESQRPGPLEIYVMEANGNNQQKITHNNSDNHWADWSPDENHIIFSHNQGSDFEIVVIDTNGSNQQFITNNSANDWAPAWRPDSSVGIDDQAVENNMPKSVKLFQNYPNPFNPSTTINYSVPELSIVTLKIYDVLGNEIATLINEEKPAGDYKITFIADNLPSGVYFYQLKAKNYIETNKMVLMK